MLIIFTNERANFSEFQFCWKISLVGKRTGKSIATLTKKQGKWSVINRRTYYESKAISGLIARILIDIFDSSPGRGEGKVVAIDGTRVPTTIVRARSVIYIE